MRTLVELGTHYGTDKVQHGYAALYDFLFAKYRDEPIQLCEIGFQFGNSLRTWREYFTRALILGIDVVQNGVEFPPEDGIALRIGNAYEHAMIESLGNAQFDIAIDDGDHSLASQLFFVQFYVPMLAPGGIAVVEDIANPKHLPQLRKAVPDGFQSVSVDLRKEGGLEDSVLLLIWHDMIAEARIVSLERELALFTKRSTKAIIGETPRQVRASKILSVKHATIMRLCGGFCFYCDLKLTEEIMTCDHLVPVSKGGSNGLRNLVPCCSVCNRKKGDRMPIQQEVERAVFLHNEREKPKTARKMWPVRRLAKLAERSPRSAFLL